MRRLDGLGPVQLRVGAAPARIELHPGPGATVVEVAGDLDHAATDRLSDAIDAAVGPTRTVVLDLREVRWIDPNGLGLLVRRSREHLRLAVVLPRSAGARGIVDLSGIGWVVETVASPGDVLAA